MWKQKTFKNHFLKTSFVFDKYIGSLKFWRIALGLERLDSFLLEKLTGAKETTFIGGLICTRVREREREREKESLCLCVKVCVCGCVYGCEWVCVCVLERENKMKKILTNFFGALNFNLFTTNFKPNSSNAKILLSLVKI